MSAANRCEVNVAHPDEDCGRQIAYTACGAPAHWYVEPRTGNAYDACEAHAREAIRWHSDEVAGIDDGDPVALDGDGEIVRAP